MTLPSPGLFVNFWSPEISRDAYPTLDGFLADVVRILREEALELARLGAAYIQIDAPHYPLLLDPAYNLGTAIGVGRQSLARYLFNLRAWARWLWAFVTHRRQGRITGHCSNLPGTAVVDAAGEVHWVHRGTGLGDHPPVKRILREIDRLT